MAGVDVAGGGAPGALKRAGSPPRTGSGIVARIVTLALARDEAGAARRLAGGAFAMRVLNAGLGFVTQILLARWMGDTQYGIYAYVWVWVLTLGGILSLGAPVAALKFVPDYSHRGDLDGLRGFLRLSRTTALLPSLAAAALAALGLTVAFRLAGSPADLHVYWASALVALAVLPIYVLTDIQTGIARAYDFADLGLAADYMLRPLLLLVFAGGLVLAGAAFGAVPVMLATLAAVAITAAAQGAVLQRRIAARVPSGPIRADWGRWTTTAAPLLAVTGFILLLSATDILVLRLFVGPEEIARYYAATKVVAVASFVAYGVSATSSHRFAAHMASGDRAAATRLAAETVRWTFWPTLAVIVGLVALSRPLLSLFGPDFGDAWPVLAILSLGLLAQAAVGPADRALSMMEESAVTARIYAIAFGVALLGTFVLAPLLGLPGAALATALAFVAKSALLHAAAKKRLGLDMFVFARAAPAAAAALRTEIVTAEEAAQGAAAWRELAASAIEPNAFFGPDMALPGLRHLPEGRGARVLRVWRDGPDGPRLAGLLPIVHPRGRLMNPLPIRRAAAIYGTVSTPLIAPDAPHETLAAMLAALRRAGIHGLALPYLGEGGPVMAALRQATGPDDERRIAILARHERAFLHSPLGGEAYLKATFDGRRRREFERKRRLLAERGPIAFRVAHDPEGVAAVLDRFLALERSGWKGRFKTDMASAPGAELYIREATAAMAAAGAFRAVALDVGGETVAAGLVAHAGSRAFFLKIAYDEAWSKASPGLLLTLDLTAHLQDDPATMEADSIAVADHPMIDRIWTERLAMASVVVATGRPGPLFRAAVLFERLRDEARVRSARTRVQFAEWRASRGKHAATKTDGAPAS